MLAYLAILACALGGLFHAPVWMVAIGGVLLWLIANLPRLGLYREACALGHEGASEAVKVMAQSMINGLVACATAYLMGFLIGFAVV